MKQWQKLLIAGLGVAALAMAPALMTSGGQDSLAVAVADPIYVDADASGDNDGSTWEDAFTTLQPALDGAVVGDQIWVAAGIYTPTYEFSPGNPRSATFQLKNGVALYGGFDPSVGDVGWEDRDWVGNVTVLSGELGDPGNADNSYHVFNHPSGTDLDSTAILDGFTVTGGNADGIGPDSAGGGMLNWFSSSPTLINCTFEGNSASDGGGGMSNAASSPTLTNCTFEGNSANGPGGGMSNGASSPTLTNCTFSGNSAGWAGGGVFNSASSPTLTNCTFSGNSAYLGGGIHNLDSPSLTLTNCTLSGNSADVGGGMHNYSSSPTLTNCTFSGNSATWNGGGMSNGGNSSPTLTNCILWGNGPDQFSNTNSTLVVTYSDIQGGYEGEGNIDAYPWFVESDNGDFHLGACSPCIDRGDNLARDLPDFDFEGDDRILDGDDDGTATVDMGVDEVAVAGTCFRVYLPLTLKDH